MSTSIKACGRCGMAILPDAPEGFCLLCLVREGAASRQRTSSPLFPDRFAGYEILEEIGRGGMGKVYRARHVSLDRLVALKVIPSGQMGSQDVVDRFRIEAAAAASLDHPNIVPLYEVGEHDEWSFFSMRLVEGPTLRKVLSTGPLQLEHAARLMAAVARAIHHAHERGVLHRDLKPGNIILDAAGQPHVTDFGLAKFIQRGSDLTITRSALGTPAYMSPEQAAGRLKEITIATDIYGLGAAFFEALTGNPPFTGETAMDVARRVIDEEPHFPSSMNGTVPLDLAVICLKCLEKEPARRYSTAAALADDLERWLRHEPIQALAPTPAERLAKWVRRKPVHAALAATAVLAIFLLVGAGVISVRQAIRANRAEREATLTLADMYTRSGLSASVNDGPAPAALWFVHAALIGADDPARAEANLRRAATWRQEATTPVRAFNTGFDHLQELIWNPRFPAMIVHAENSFAAQVWNLETEEKWEPAAKLAPGRAVWDAKGNRVALLLPDRDLVVLAFPSGKELARRSGAGGGLSWSPDGKWLAYGNVLWDWQGTETRSIPAMAGQVRFSPDGKLALSQWGTQTAICSIENPEQLLHPPVTSRLGDRSDFMPDGKSYFAGHENGNLVIRDSLTGAVLETHSGGPINRATGLLLAVSPDGRFFARRDLPVLDRHQPGMMIFPPRGQVHDASFSPDGSLLASGSYENRLQIWSVPEGKLVTSVAHHTAVVNVRFSPDGQFVASGQDGLVRLWRVRRSELLRAIPVGENTLVALSSDGRSLAPSGLSNVEGKLTRTRVFDIVTGEPVGPELDPRGLILDVVFNQGDSLAIAVSTTVARSNAILEKSGGEGNVQLWNYRTGERLDMPIPMPSEPRGLALHPSGKWLGVGCAGGEGVEIDLTNRSLRVLFKQGKPVHAGATLNNGRCAYSPDGQIFAIWGLYQFIHLWDREQGRFLINPHEPVHNTFDLAFYDSTIARAVVGGPMRIEFLNSSTGGSEAPPIPYINWPFLSRFSTDGKLLLTAGGGRNAQLWDWRQGKLACPMLSHDEAIMAGCFVPGKPWVITGGHDGKIKFWDQHTGMMIRPPVHLENRWVLQLQITQDARTLIASGLLNGKIELIDLQAALPTPSEIDASMARLLSEIDAGAEIHPGGGLAHLTPQAWLEKWQEFRKRYPNYPDHRLTPARADETMAQGIPLN